jgi:polyisoprenoid-binding protein YceI
MATAYTVDLACSDVSFVVRHMMVAKLRGHFRRWEAQLVLDEKDLAASSMTLSIDAASVDTRDATRDEQLRSPDFFDVAAHPKITFASSKVEVIAGDVFLLRGDLTIKGVSQPVVLEAERLGKRKDPSGDVRVAFEAKGSIDRYAFGLKWNQALEGGGVLFGPKVDVEIDLQAIAPRA